MNDNNLQQRIIRLKQEVLALKSAKKAGLLIQNETYVVPGFQYVTGLSKITYDDGIQPIITSDYSQVHGTLFAPEGNEQYFYYAGSGAIGDLNLQSTRKILSVEWISS